MTGDISDLDSGDPMDDEQTSETEGAAEPVATGGPAGGVPAWAQWGLLVAALAVLIAGTVAWRNAGDDGDIGRAERRDAALIAAHRQIETMQTMDHREVDEHLKRWTSVTTGVLHDQLVAISGEDRQLLKDQQKRSTGRVVDAALTSLGRDTATVLAAVEVTTIDDASPGEEPVVKRNRFAADLVLRDGAWKLENLQQVAVNLS